MVILIITHARSGTHYTIDSILKNFKNTQFPLIRPSFMSVENLYFPHDSKVTDSMHDFLFKGGDENQIKIFKTHLTPFDFEAALNNKYYFPNPKDREIVEWLYKNAKKVYVSRDVRDVMVSLFYFMKAGNGIHNALATRIQEITISEFIRSPNYRITPCRFLQDYDRNLITYWANHIKQWNEHGVIKVKYENLKKDFSSTIKKLADDLVANDLLKEKIEEPQFRKETQKLHTRMVIKLLRSITNFRSTAVYRRKGIVGDHKAHFTKEDYDFIYENIKAINIPDAKFQKA